MANPNPATTSQADAPISWKVELRVYDIARGMARSFSPMLVGKQVEGIWHTGLSVYGLEYFFGGGILRMTPEEFEHGYNLTPTKVIPLGTTEVDEATVNVFLAGIDARFTTDTYDLTDWNCNHFTDELSKFLLGEGIPDYILNQARDIMQTPIGRWVIPMLKNQQKMVQQRAINSGQRTLWSRGDANTDDTANSNSSATPALQPVSLPQSLPNITEQLQQLQSMGFADEELNRRVLSETRGDISAAINRLVNSSF